MSQLKTRLTYSIDYSRHFDEEDKSHKGHKLPVNALALGLYSSNPALAKSSSQNAVVLFSAGRDAAIRSWDLGIDYQEYGTRHRQRERERQSTIALLSSSSKDKRKQQRRMSAGSLLGTVQTYNKSSRNGHIQHQDKEQSAANSRPRDKYSSPPDAKQLHKYEHHSDWVTAITLVNKNQQLVSASHDRTILLWPSAISSMPGTATRIPTRIGNHLDYIKCLSYASSINAVFSGGCDGRIHMWDIIEPRSTTSQPTATGVTMIHDDTNPSGSIYCLASNALGTTVAAGGPDKIVKLFDRRSKKSQNMLLRGHSDTVRAVLVSEDGRTVASGGSDATVKVWDVRMGRCSVTYTHHSDSVWTLHSPSSTLDVIYSGSRDGWVSKIFRVKGNFEDNASVVGIVKESHGITSIAALEHAFLWTSNSGDSMIRRYRDVRLPPELELEETEDALLGTQENDHAKGRVQAVMTLGRQGLVRSMSDNFIKTNEQQELATTNHIPQDRAAMAQNVQSDTKSSSGSAVTAPLSSVIQQPAPVVLSEDNQSVTRSSSIRYSYGNCSETFSQHHQQQPPRSTSLLAQVPPQPPLASQETQQTTANADSKPSTLSSVSFAGGRTQPPTTTPSKMSPQQNQTESEQDDEEDDEFGDIAYSLDDRPGLFTDPESIIPGTAGIIKHATLNNRRFIITLDSERRLRMWDIIRGVMIKDLGTLAPEEQLETVVAKENMPEWVPSWCSVDVKTGSIHIHLEDPKCFDAEAYYDEVTQGWPDAPHEFDDFKVNLGQWIMVYLLWGYRTYMKGDGSVKKVEESVGNAPNVGGQARATVLQLNVQSSATDEEHERNDGVPPRPDSTATQVTGPPSTTQIPSLNIPTSGSGQPSPSFHTPSAATESPIPPTTARESQHDKTPSGSSQTPVHTMDDTQNDFVPKNFPKLALPPSTPIIVSMEDSTHSCGYLDMYRTTVGEVFDKAKSMNEWLPDWIADAVTADTLIKPPDAKVAFTLLPHPGSDLPQLISGTNRLNSPRNTRIKKVLEYAIKNMDYTKGKASSSGSATQDTLNDLQNLSTSGNGYNAQQYLEILCNDKVLEPQMTMVSARQFVWKQGGDMPLTYRMILRDVSPTK